MTDDKGARAAELALGLLEGDELTEALHDVTADPEMREAYRIWNERLVSLCETGQPPALSPGDHVFANVESALFAEGPDEEGWSLWDMIRAPENRGLVVMVMAAKAMLLAWILYLFF